jgi:hypothetical protein
VVCPTLGVQPPHLCSALRWLHRAPLPRSTQAPPQLHSLSSQGYRTYTACVCVCDDASPHFCPRLAAQYITLDESHCPINLEPVTFLVVKHREIRRWCERRQSRPAQRWHGRNADRKSSSGSGIRARSLSDSLFWLGKRCVCVGVCVCVCGCVWQCGCVGSLGGHTFLGTFLEHHCGHTRNAWAVREHEHVCAASARLASAVVTSQLVVVWCDGGDSSIVVDAHNTTRSGTRRRSQGSCRNVDHLTLYFTSRDTGQHSYSHTLQPPWC